MHHKILKSLSEKGFRLTVARKEILAILIESDDVFTAADIHDELTSRGVTVNLSTIYREIQFLEEQCIIHAVYLNQNSKAYRLVQGCCCVQLCCKECGYTQCAGGSIIANTSESYVKEHHADFDTSNSEIIIYGLCQDCSNHNAASKKSCCTTRRCSKI